LHKKKKLIQNPFKRASFTFSHINISRNPNLFISIFLFDEAAERYRVRNRLPEKYFFCLSGKYYHRSHRWYSLFHKYHFHSSTGNRGKRIFKPWFFKGFRNFVNSRIYLKRLKTSISRPKKQFRRVTQFERIFRSKLPKKKFVSKKGSYSRLRRSSKVKDSFHDRKHFSLDHNIKYPSLLRIALSKGRYTPLLFKKISKYNQKLLLMRKEALSYQMRFIYDNRRLLRQLKLKKINRLNEKIRKRNAFVKGIDARMGTKTKKIKERKLVYKIKKRDPKTKKWSLKKKFV